MAWFRRPTSGPQSEAPARPEETHARATTFLDPATLARISNLELLAKTVVDGFMGGLHRSVHLGTSLDFAEHRPYMAGDDTRRIDWRLFARSDRFYLKQYEADSLLNFSVLLDVSASMNYGSGPVTKLDYARYLASCLSYFSNQQRDRVGFVAFDEDLLEVLPPSRKHLSAVLHAIARVQAVRPGQFEAPFQKLAEHFRRKSMIVLISDLYAPPEQIVESLRYLRQTGNDVMVMHVLDPAEIEFPFEDSAPFEDAEVGTRMSVVPALYRDQYLALMQAHIAELEERMVRVGIDYALFNTSQPLDYALFHFLGKRHGLMNARSC